VCDLRITTLFEVDPLDPADVAHVLRAAPQLKEIRIDHCVQGDASWLAPAAPRHPAAFEGLVHPRLREFGIARDSAGTPLDDGWVAHLRRRHFPRLRVLAIGEDMYFVTPPDCQLREIGPTAPACVVWYRAVKHTVLPCFAPFSQMNPISTAFHVRTFLMAN
jgi:hypothetical protein